MNLTALIGPVLGIVTATSTSVAIDNAVKIITPTGIKAIHAFGIKVGVAIAGGIVGNKIAEYVTSHVDSITETVMNTGTDTTETTQEDN